MKPEDCYRYPYVKSERMKVLEELEAAGWGSVPQYLIPKNWREIAPPPAAEGDAVTVRRIDCGSELGRVLKKAAG